jgi:hypothetical protein
MRPMLGLLVGALLVAAIFSANAQAPRTRESELGHGPPGLKPSQVEDLLKDDRKKSIDDTAEILDLATALKDELEKNDKHVLSLSAIKRAEEIEKLAKRIRSRMKRF